MNKLPETIEDTMSILYDKRSGLEYLATMAKDLKNYDGARILKSASDALTLIIDCYMELPF